LRFLILADIHANLEALEAVLERARGQFDQSENRYLINPGSVGQPRDDDPRAAFAVYDRGKALVSYFRVEYPVGQVQQKMRRAGLPGYLADRLSRGW
jgi:diadenosine tetraphosphatase ApaH/serine/threonine PP2A family protein phosphatase